MRPTYIPLHGHSTYSLGDGVARIGDIIDKALEMGSDAVGLTEHGNMASFYKFYTQARDRSVKPIIGCELYVNDLYYEDNDRFLELKRQNSEDGAEDEYGAQEDASNAHLLAYCKNYDGVKELIHLSNFGFFNFYRKPLLSNDLIVSRLGGNHIVTTGCLQSMFNRHILTQNDAELRKILKRYYLRFGRDFYFEIQFNDLKEQYAVNKFYEGAYKKLGIKPVFSLDYHYVNEDDWFIQYLLYVIKQRETVKSMPPEKWFYSVRNLYIKSIDEVVKTATDQGFSKEFIELAIESTFEIRDKVDIVIPKYPDNFPKFTDSKEESYSIFKKKLNAKFKEKVENGLIPDGKVEEYRKRMKYELDVIEKKDIIDYFLILEDIIHNFVYKNDGALGAGRGSAGGSLVLFVLDITKIDPIKQGLIFERFLNPARIDPPDIDVDIDSVTQRQVESYIKGKYGDNKVCHIANFGKFGAKTIIKDLCRVFELDYNLSNELTSHFDSVKADLAIDKQLESVTGIARSLKNDKLIKFIQDNSELFISVGSKLLNIVRQTGKHASGILISNRDLVLSDIPIMRVNDEIVTAVQEGGDEREVAELGYCKLDILGLNTASIINAAFKLVAIRHPDQTGLEHALLSSDFDDVEVYKEFLRGNCRDIFQFGSDNMINLIMKIKPKSLLDLTTINALFRPAIIYSGGIDEFLINKDNAEEAKRKLDAVHPNLWPILGDTFGIPCFQEQVMFILQSVGGFTLSEADNARKILKLLHKGNQEKTDNFFKMLEKFRAGAVSRGMKEKDIDWLLDILGKYSEYSFNKSHSLAYAINAYLSMYLKVHYPLEYYCALLNHSTNDELNWYIKQINEVGIKFEEFKLGEVTPEFSINYENGTIRYSLAMVKGLSAADIEDVVACKVPTEDLIGLIKYIHEKKIGKRTYEALCRLRFFRDYYKDAKFIETAIIATKGAKKKFQEKYDEVCGESYKVDDYTEAEFLAFERDYLSFYISEHPFEKMKKYIQNHEKGFFDIAYSPAEAKGLKPGQYVLYGIINDIINKKSKKTGRDYYKLVLEDDKANVFITVFNSADLRDVEVGSMIVIFTDKNDFGFSKSRKEHITVIDTEE